MAAVPHAATPCAAAGASTNNTRDDGYETDTATRRDTMEVGDAALGGGAAAAGVGVSPAIVGTATNAHRTSPAHRQLNFSQAHLGQ
jgi:hypothetical protein